MTYPNQTARRSYHRQPRLRQQLESRCDSLADQQQLRPDARHLAAIATHGFDKRNLAKRGLRVGRTAVGKGLFATKRIVDGSCIGEIEGLVIADDDYVSRYAFDLDDGRQLEPSAPFRFVNHCCAPNCAFQNFSFPGEPPTATPTAISSPLAIPSSTATQLGSRSEAALTATPQRKLLLFSICDIDIGQELTIDYNWPAIFAIPCACRSAQCRGWIVAPQDLPQLIDGFQPEEIDDSPLRSA